MSHAGLSHALFTSNPYLLGLLLFRRAEGAELANVPDATNEDAVENLRRR